MRNIILSLLLICGGFALRAEATFSFILVSKDGSKVAYALHEQPRITFADDDMVISVNGLEIAYPAHEFAKITYETTTGLEMVNPDGKKITPFDYTGDSLIFPAPDRDLSVRIYAGDGRLMLSQAVETGSALTVPVNSFVSGVYLVNVNGLTYKIVKR